MRPSDPLAMALRDCIDLLIAIALFVLAAGIYIGAHVVVT